MRIAICAILALAVGCGSKTEEPQGTQPVSNPGTSSSKPSSKSGFDCKALLTEADIAAFGAKSLKESSHNDFHHDYRVMDGETMLARVQYIQSGQSGYNGSLEGTKMLAKGMKVGNQEIKAELNEENKYGEKSYYALLPHDEQELAFYKGKVYVNIKSGGTASQEVIQNLPKDMQEKLKSKNGAVKSKEETEKLLRKIAEIILSRLP